MNQDVIRSAAVLARGCVEALAPPGVPASAPFPANVRAFTTLRHGAGGSAAPFDSFNLGNFRGPEGDDPETVARNRAELVARFGLPSWPHWLRQVHGTRVLRFDAPAGPPPQPSPASGGGSLGTAWAAAHLDPAGDPLPAPPAGEGWGTNLSEAAYPPVAHLPPPPAGEGRGGGLSEATSPSVAHLPPPPAGEGRGGGLTEAAYPSVAHFSPPPEGEGRGRDLSEAAAPGLEPEADASVTSAPGVVLAILTADCLPVVFAARDGSELAVAHAGWPGLSKGMLEATLAAMRTPPRELVAWIGPCAGPARYEVGRNVFDAFVGPDPGAAAAFSPVREGHWLADLPALARRRLAAAGMRVADIHGGDLCTISWPDRFFSHRRDGRSGRIATLAWIAPGG